MRDLKPYRSDELQVHKVPIPGWEGIELPVVQAPDRRLWWPVRAICEDVFGIDTAGQITRLKADEDTSQLVEKMEIQMPVGKRKTTMLEFDGLAIWLTKLQTNNMTKPEVRARVKKFKRLAYKAFNDILWDRSPQQRELYAMVEKALMEGGPSETEQLTVEGLRAGFALLEDRSSRLEDVVFGKAYVNEHEEEGEEAAGVLNIPFIAPRGGHYVLRLRQVPWSAPEIIGIYAIE